MKLFLLTIAIVGLCIFGMCFNIIFRKDGQFPDGEISHNRELRKRGIICAKEEELKMWGKRNNVKNPTCSDLGCSSCRGCEISRESE
ncbi:MAG: hypothetical protein HUJ91_04350 [Bacteroidales bacterium]|nr:hypothetical protein [Bacteroidales bacterium]